MRGKIDDPQAWLSFARRDFARARQEISSEGLADVEKLFTQLFPDKPGPSA